MNNPMKLKYHSLYGQLLQDRMLMNAWKQVKANKGSGGIDGVTINEYVDLFSRKIVSWVLTKDMTAESVLEAIKIA